MLRPASLFLGCVFGSQKVDEGVKSELSFLDVAIIPVDLITQIPKLLSDGSTMNIDNRTKTNYLPVQQQSRLDGAWRGQHVLWPQARVWYQLDPVGPTQQMRHLGTVGDMPGSCE